MSTCSVSSTGWKIDETVHLQHRDDDQVAGVRTFMTILHSPLFPFDREQKNIWENAWARGSPRESSATTPSQAPSRVRGVPDWHH